MKNTTVMTKDSNLLADFPQYDTIKLNTNRDLVSVIDLKSLKSHVFKMWYRLCQKNVVQTK